MVTASDSQREGPDSNSAGGFRRLEDARWATRIVGFAGIYKLVESSTIYGVINVLCNIILSVAFHSQCQHNPVLTNLRILSIWE